MRPENLAFAAARASGSLLGSRPPAWARLAIAPCLPTQVSTEGVSVNLWRETIIVCSVPLSLAGEVGVRGSHQDLLLVFAQRLGHAEYVRRPFIYFEKRRQD